MITPYPWFGPRSGFGWGWTPVTWEGWAVVILWFAALALAYHLLGSTRAFAFAVAGLVVLLIVICALTGTPPG